MAKVICYVQLGGLGSRLFPLTHQPGMRSIDVFTSGRNIKQFNHNSYFAVAKPVLPYFGVSLSEPLIRSAVMAGVKDIRGTLLVMPETVTSYYFGRDLGNGVTMRKFLFESTRLDTAGGIVRDVAAGIRDGSIKNEDTILILGGDIRTDLNISQFLEEHWRNNSDITIMLASVPREEMYRFGAAVREGDSTPKLGTIRMKISPTKEDNFDVYGQLNLNPDKMAKITRFYEKRPKLEPSKVLDKGGLDINSIYNIFGPGALSPTNLQNGSVYAIRAELLNFLAPLTFNVHPNASSTEWAETTNINLKGPGAFSDFGGHWFMALTGSKPMPTVDPNSPIREVQEKIIDHLKRGLPQIFGFKHDGYWSDDGTLPSVLKGHFDILDDLVKNGQNSMWPINWHDVKRGYPTGIITMSDIQEAFAEIIPPVFIGRNVKLNQNATVGPYAVIGDGWEISGYVAHSVLFPEKRIDREIKSKRKRFFVSEEQKIVGSIIGSGFEEFGIDQDGKLFNMNDISNKIVVSNGYSNVVSPLDI